MLTRRKLTIDFVIEEGCEAAPHVCRILRDHAAEIEKRNKERWLDETGEHLIANGGRATWRMEYFPPEDEAPSSPCPTL